MTDQNPPTAKRGIRGTALDQVADPAQVTLPGQPTSEFAAMTRDPNQHRPETTLINTTQLPAEERALAATGFSDASDAFDFTSDGLVVRDPERQSTIREALHAHRAILHGLLARKSNEPSLNPASKEHEIGAISRGIARAEQVLREIEPESPDAS